MMAELQDRVSIELIDAGEHKDRVVLVLSKVKGLVMTPHQLVNHTPCTVALNVPREPAEKLKAYLEKAGAMVMLEGERQAEHDAPEAPAPTDSSGDMTSEEEPEQGLEPEAPASFEPVPVSATDSASNGLSDADLTGFAGASPVSEAPVPPELPVIEPVHEPPEDRRPTSKIRQVFAKFPLVGSRSNNRLQEASGADIPSASDQVTPPPVKKIPELFSHPAAFLVVGFLAGALITGLWGMMEINRMKQEQADYEQDTAQKIIEESATLKNLVQQRTQEVQTLQQKNSDLETQMASVIAQLQGAQPLQAITPSSSPAAMPSWEHDLVQAFDAAMTRHIQGLSQGYEAQKQAACSFQVLLDGAGTSAYAQVVKQFDSQYTLYDIRRNDSLLVPFVAEVKIPFQQEQRSGQTLAACQAEKPKRLDTPDHHEFGEYYGYWTIEYHYRQGQWVVNQTVIERNRALYENAFQKGSPEYAKFRIDANLFPAFKAQP